MTAIRNLIAGLVFVLLPMHVFAAADDMISEVYRDDNISISAGVTEIDSTIIHFGDVLSLLMTINYDDSKVRLQQPDTKYFSSTWLESKGIFLKDLQSSQQSGSGDLPFVDKHVFRFQIIGCPEATELCRGTRTYEIPEFTLKYDLIDPEGAVVSTHEAKFRPWPENVKVASTLALNEDGELDGFLSYFPTGAYPQPLSGIDSRYTSLGFIAGGLFLLLGGMLMSPFNFFKRKTSVAKINTRWEQPLEQLRSGAFTDDEHQLDALRRSVVWYCTDKLGVDPFYWIKHQDEVSGKQQKVAGELAGFRDLFTAILLSPRGQSKQLLDRFLQLTAKDK